MMWYMICFMMCFMMVYDPLWCVWYDAWSVFVGEWKSLKPIDTVLWRNKKLFNFFIIFEIKLILFVKLDTFYSKTLLWIRRRSGFGCEYLFLNRPYLYDISKCVQVLFLMCLMCHILDNSSPDFIYISFVMCWAFHPLFHLYYVNMILDIARRHHLENVILWCFNVIICVFCDVFDVMRLTGSCASDSSILSLKSLFKPTTTTGVFGDSSLIKENHIR